MARCELRAAAKPLDCACEQRTRIELAESFRQADANI
jgi:hypothetical protein